MTTTRRTFLTLSGAIAAVAATGRLAPALADRIRVLPDSPAGAATFPPAGASPFPTGRSPELERAVRALDVGDGFLYGGLAIVPLHGGARWPRATLTVATLDESRAAGALLITERPSPTVPEVTVENRGRTHVLLMAGEILVGGKQNRVLREDILLPPRSGPRAIGVYCVEQGRWDDGRRDFESKSSFAQPGLRQQLYDKADQRSVWSEVARSARAAAAPSPTSSYQQVYEQPRVREYADDVERALRGKLPGATVGAAVFVGATLSGLDLFVDSGLFAREWHKLMRAHAAEAYSQPSATPGVVSQMRAQTEMLLTAAADAHGIVRGNAGVGQLFEFTLKRHRGAALGHEGALIHAAIV